MQIKMQKCTKDIRECTKFNGKRNKGADTRIRFRRNGGRRKKRKEEKRRRRRRRQWENKYVIPQIFRMLNPPCHSHIEPEIMLGI